jgi:hypothetical protein
MKERSTLTDNEKKLVNDKTNQRFNQLMETARTGRRGPFASLVEMLYNETGDSMYKMITTVRNVEKLRARNQAVMMPVQASTPPPGQHITFYS